jgi:hypothetical protein
MHARTMMPRGEGETRHDDGTADERWILAVGKRIDHRWIVEMKLGRRHGMPPAARRGRPAHAV